MALVKLKAPACSVWFGNLHSKVTDRHLLELGTQAGPVTRASRSKDANYGFVEYADVESAIYCVGLYSGVLKLFGQSVNVDFSNRPVNELKPEEQALLDRCLKLINAAHYINGNVGAVRRGGREAQRYTPYGDAKGHREQRAAMRAPTRFNDDYTDTAYGAADAAGGYGKSAESVQAYGWPGGAAAAAPAAPPVQLDSSALAAMQAAAVAAAAATGFGGRPATHQPAQQPQQPHQHVQVQVQPSAWPGAVPAASAPTVVQLPHAAPSAQAVVIVQQQPQQPQQQPHAVYQQQRVYQQPQQHQVVQHVPAAAPQYHQPQLQHAYQAVQQVSPAAAYQQQWQQSQQQQQQQYYQQQQGQYAVQPQGQYAVQQQQGQYAQPAAAPTNGAFQSSMPGAVQGQYQYQAAGAGQYAPPQQQQGTWYYQ